MKYNSRDYNYFLDQKQKAMIAGLSVLDASNRERTFEEEKRLYVKLRVINLLQKAIAFDSIPRNEAEQKIREEKNGAKMLMDALNYTSIQDLISKYQIGEEELRYAKSVFSDDKNNEAANQRKLAANAGKNFSLITQLVEVGNVSKEDVKTNLRNLFLTLEKLAVSPQFQNQIQSTKRQLTAMLENSPENLDDRKRQTINRILSSLNEEMLSEL